MINGYVTVALVDSGIDTQISNLNDFVIKSTGFHINNEGYIVENCNKKIEHIHGSIIAHIIKEICKNVKFISVNIFNEKLVTDGRVLINSLIKTLDFKPDIINLSLGTTKFRYKFALAGIVKEAIKRNIIVVSAANNEGNKSYPAYLKGVVGVKGDNNIDFDKYTFKKNMYYAPAFVEEFNNMDNINEYSGSSLSAGYITGHLSKIICEKNVTNFDEATQLLKKFAF